MISYEHGHIICHMALQMARNMVQDTHGHLARVQTDTETMMQNDTNPPAQLARPTMPVPEAGRRYFGLNRQASYEAARRGDLPTIRIGGRIFAVVRAIEDRLAAVS
jgi:hypothetical protein